MTDWTSSSTAGETSSEYFTLPPRMRHIRTAYTPSALGFAYSSLFVMDSAKYRPRPYSVPVLPPAKLSLKSLVHIFLAAAALVPWKRYHSLHSGAKRFALSLPMLCQATAVLTSVMGSMGSLPSCEASCAFVSSSARLTQYSCQLSQFSLRKTATTSKPLGTCLFSLCLERSRVQAFLYVMSNSFWKSWKPMAFMSTSAGGPSPWLSQ
mmetsp:Transcript_48426/g.144647  ORF Transcript_48426/g.144647 Transcript_48426/m.144647 type:complete len:208 (-) Transcript_48426:447-1070(-)